jgi:uncharacterized tellurite resistance protein B-like protein
LKQELVQSKAMNHKVVLIKLYYLLVNADGNVNEKEIVAGKQMMKAEGINDFEFDRQVDSLKKRNPQVVLSECIEELKKLDREKQVRCMAWLSAIANADGFMDKTEWHFIYQLYHKELNLPLAEVMNKQKELIGLKEKSLRMLSVL